MSHHIILYSKPDCHLCEIAYRLLLGLRGEFDLTIEEIDLSRDPTLLQRYHEKIPVAVIDGHITLTAPIRAADVRAALKKGQ